MILNEDVRDTSWLLIPIKLMEIPDCSHVLSRLTAMAPMVAVKQAQITPKPRIQAWDADRDVLDVIIRIHRHSWEG